MIMAYKYGPSPSVHYSLESVTHSKVFNNTDRLHTWHQELSIRSIGATNL